jgi:hypothetical protein
VTETLPGRAEIVALLHEHDDPDRLEQPAGFQYDREQARFASLVTELEHRFTCSCEAEAGLWVQDASYLGQLTIPTDATASKVPIFVRVSNFGHLALVGVARPGCYDDRETLALIAPEDLRQVIDAITYLGYVPLFEDVLNERYDGMSEALKRSFSTYPATWFTRYFDYL